MKKQPIILVLLMSSLVFQLVSGLSASEDETVEDSFVYLPLVIDTSDLLFSDDFSNPNSGWPVDDDGVVKWGYSNGEYEILIRDQRRWAGALAPVMVLDNYMVRVDARRLQGSTSDYGIVFDQKDWDNFYYLVVDAGDQWFGVAEVVDGDPAIVIPRTNSAVIKPGNAINQLQVEKNGQEIQVTINGSWLAKANSSSGTNSGAGVGLYMEGDEDVPAVVHYDNFEIWRLEKEQSQSAEMRLMGMNHESGSDFDAYLGWDVED